MLQALWSASSGMLAQQTAMDTVANNIANVNTPGYKKNRVDFQDLLYSQIRTPERVTITGQVVQNGLQVGNGTRLAATQILFEQGSLQPTGNPTDFAISGDAFFEILLPDGRKAYTRDGSFKVDADGYLVTANGELVNMESADGGLVTFSQGAGKINIDAQGKISQDTPLLQLEPYTFSSPKDLEQVEAGIFKPTDTSGEAILISEMAEEETEELVDEEGNLLPAEERTQPQAYYQVILPDGETAYTTESSFKIDEESRLVTTGKGYPLEPEVTVDTEAGEVSLLKGDVVTADREGMINVPEEIGSLNIIRFANPAGLEKLGGNLYVPTVNSGGAQAALEYTVTAGTLEMSNVQIAEEMVNMMMANRAYELNSRSIKTSDEMLGTANQLLRR